MNRRQQQQGIALITTLIMLSVVTVMAVAFLAVSRRERASVATSTDRLDARAMAEAALQRAEAEVVARVLATSNLLSYDLLVSTNYLNPAGFNASDSDINNANVSFVYPNGQPVEGDDLLRLYRNLQVDARVPVFVVTNNASGEEEFRFYLDLNRNSWFDTNGVQREIDRNGRALGITNFHIGDPEWIGVLRRPDLAHSGTNPFVGRFAFFIVPSGKTLDLNFIHNHAKHTLGAAEGFMRNQGVGPWEINLAAFLRELNTNAWDGYFYRTNRDTPNTGIAFDHADFILRQRYRVNPSALPTHENLQTIQNLYGSAGANAFLLDGIDGYSDGPWQLDLKPATTGTGVNERILDEDFPGRPWPGAPNPSQYFAVEELFTLNDTRLPASAFADQFTNRLFRASLGRSTYDRHTFYRLMSQLGTESVVNDQVRMHLNYDNRLDFNPALTGRLPDPDVGYHGTNFVRWTSTAFFTNAADRIIKALHPSGPDLPLVAVTNIGIWPTNYYSPAVHRSLQLAANIYDATTNRPVVEDPRLPTVMRPVFGPDPTLTGGVRIEGYEELTDDWDSRLWSTAHLDIDEAEARPTVRRYDRVAGIPVIIGARKGFPNFNEFELQTVAVAGRKLELVKRSPSSRPAFTNQLYTLGISNVFGVEFWNSYSNAYPRPLELRVRLEYDMVLSNENRAILIRTGVAGYTNTFGAGTWNGRQFQIPIYTNLLFLPTSAYRSDGRLFPVSTNRALNLFEPAIGFPIPTWRLMVTNRLQAILVDRGVAGGRIVDYVDLDNLNSVIDITQELFGNVDDVGQTSATGSFWRTNRVAGIPEGVRNQIQASLGSINVSTWNSASSEPVQGSDKEKSIERFREFVGLVPGAATVSPTLRMQAPFSPGIKLLHYKSWQVNDPLVNDLYWDLEDPQRTNNIQRLPPLFPVTTDRSNIGKVNQRYRPWQPDQNSSAPTRSDFHYWVKDPQITGSDAWNFPTNLFANVGGLGQVHRGTPWQTVYLKSRPVPSTDWFIWSGHPVWGWPGGVIPLGTEPTNDWRIVDLFTTATDINATRGRLSVNQTGTAAWSAVLSGVAVMTNLFGASYGPYLIEPGTPEIQTVVAGINAAREQRFGRKYNYLGEILSAPTLSAADPGSGFWGSPYLRAYNGGDPAVPPDGVVERLPQMILSLLRVDEPRFVVYAYGQSLRPAPDSVVTEPGPFFQMSTNYQITGEFVTKTQLRLEEIQVLDPVTRLPRFGVRAIKESYNEVPPTE